MKRFFLIAFLSCNLLIAGRTYARPLLELHVNQRGVAWFTNTGDEPVTFDGYQIQDAYEPGRLMPDYLRSVERVVAAGKIDEVLNVLGVGALGLATAGLSPSSIAEFTAGMGGTLQPGRGWWLGQIFPHDLPVGAYPRDGLLGFSFSWNGVGAPIQQNISIVVTPDIPEPSTVLLAGMGMIGLLAASMRKRCGSHRLAG